MALCATPPLQTDFELWDSLRRAARSAPRLIAEGFGRFGAREFGRYLTMARAELLELQNDLEDLRRTRLVGEGAVKDLHARPDHAAPIVAKLRSSLGNGPA